VAVISAFTTFPDAKASAQLTEECLAEHTELFIDGYSKIAAGQVRVQSKPAFLSPTSSEELLQGCFKPNLVHQVVLNGYLLQGTKTEEARKDKGVLAKFVALV
jgi:hypothetical protein